MPMQWSQRNFQMNLKIYITFFFSFEQPSLFILMSPMILIYFERKEKKKRSIMHVVKILSPSGTTPFAPQSIIVGPDPYETVTCTRACLHIYECFQTYLCEFEIHSSMNIV